MEESDFSPIAIIVVWRVAFDISTFAFPSTGNSSFCALSFDFVALSRILVHAVETSKIDFRLWYCPSYYPVLLPWFYSYLNSARFRGSSLLLRVFWDEAENTRHHSSFHQFFDGQYVVCVVLCFVGAALRHSHGRLVCFKGFCGVFLYVGGLIGIPGCANQLCPLIYCSKDDPNVFSFHSCHKKHRSLGRQHVVVLNFATPTYPLILFIFTSLFWTHSCECSSSTFLLHALVCVFVCSSRWLLWKFCQVTSIAYNFTAYVLI